MKLQLGIKSDPVENRYSLEWLFSLMRKLEIKYLQLGGFFELPLLEDSFFYDLRHKADKQGIVIKSLFTAHREMGGFFNGNKYMEKAARIIYERYIQAASIMGADYAGTSAGPVFRDKMEYKQKGIQRYFSHMKELMHLAKEKGLKGLSIEVMSSSNEFPTFPEEIDYFMEYLGSYHRANRESTVPVYLLGDISHGYADKDGKIIYSNIQLFQHAIPYMCEFHFKNTDSIFNQTFGFTREELSRGIIDLSIIKKIIYQNSEKWPVNEVTGYLEHPGPKLGRDYSDIRLEQMLAESMHTLKKYFG